SRILAAASLTARALRGGGKGQRFGGDGESNLPVHQHAPRAGDPLSPAGHGAGALHRRGARNSEAPHHSPPSRTRRTRWPIRSAPNCVQFSSQSSRVTSTSGASCTASHRWQSSAISPDLRPVYTLTSANRASTSARSVMVLLRGGDGGVGRIKQVRREN